MAIQQVTLQTKFAAWKDITNAIIVALGDNQALSTSAKISLVAAINEVVGEIGDIGTLNTDDQSSIVGAINELVATIGAIGTLSTVDKTSLVSAINEVLSTHNSDANSLSLAIDDINDAISDVVSSIKPVNLLTNRGRLGSETTKVLTTFDATSPQLSPYNSAVIAEGEKFIDDNSTHGGLNAALGADMGALVTALGVAGRSNLRNGFEFYIAEITAGAGTDDPQTLSTVDYYPILAGSDDYISHIGSGATFQCWLRVDTGAGGVLLGDSTMNTYVDGVLVAPQSLVEIADGWVHVRQTTVLTTEYKKFFPAISANSGDVVHIALPVLHGALSGGIHVGAM